MAPRLRFERRLILLRRQRDYPVAERGKSGAATRNQTGIAGLENEQSIQLTYRGKVVFTRGLEPRFSDS